MIKSIDRRSCGLMKAAEIDADNKRRPPIGLQSLVQDKKPAACTSMKVVRMDPAAVEELLQRDAAEKHWGNRIKPVRERRQYNKKTVNFN